MDSGLLEWGSSACLWFGVVSSDVKKGFGRHCVGAAAIHLCLSLYLGSSSLSSLSSLSDLLPMAWLSRWLTGPGYSLLPKTVESRDPI